MFKKKANGFTLIELLVVISILSIVVLIGIPTYQKTANKSKEKMYQTKIDNAIQSAKLWASDNLNCLKSISCNDKITNITCSDVTNNNYLCYKITLQTLAEEGYYEYDSLETKKIINPKDNTLLNDYIIYIKYNKVTGKITTY